MSSFEMRQKSQIAIETLVESSQGEACADEPIGDVTGETDTDSGIHLKQVSQQNGYTALARVAISTAPIGLKGSKNLNK